MKVIRYQDSTGRIAHAVQADDGIARELDGDLLTRPAVSARRADIAKLLDPVAPPLVFCLGLNYRRHAAEGNLPGPKFPVLFIKSGGAVQNPGDLIRLPQTLRS